MCLNQIITSTIILAAGQDQFFLEMKLFNSMIHFQYGVLRSMLYQEEIVKEINNCRVSSGRDPKESKDFTMACYHKKLGRTTMLC